MGGQDGIYVFNGDTGRIFVEGIAQSPNQIFQYYYRADVDLPPFDATGIDTVGVFEDIAEQEFTTIINDRSIIEKLFQNFENTGNKTEINVKGDFVFDIYFMNSRFDGIGIGCEVIADNRAYWIYYQDGSYTELPQDLLEQIAGKKMTTASEYIADYS